MGCMDRCNHFHNYAILDPNFTSKGFCGPSLHLLTSAWWPCRGHCNLCCPCHYKPWLLARTRAELSNKHCWRFYFYQLMQRARFLVQVVEYRSVTAMLNLGPGQQIEFFMAQNL